MAIWVCPDCDREFGAVGRRHTCRPGLTVEEFLESVPDFTGPVFHRVHDHLVTVNDGSLIVDPLLNKKLLFKNGPTFCILEVKTKWVAVGFSLRRKLESGRLSRKVLDYGDKYFHVINVIDADDVDDEFCDWLTEAYHHGQESKPSSDPMVPDDVDI